MFHSTPPAKILDCLGDIHFTASVGPSSRSSGVNMEPKKLDTRQHIDQTDVVASIPPFSPGLLSSLTPAIGVVFQDASPIPVTSAASTSSIHQTSSMPSMLTPQAEPETLDVHLWV